MKGKVRGAGNWGDECSVKSCIIRGERLDANINRGYETTEAGSLLQYFTLIIEKADLLLRRWLVPWSTLGGSPLRSPRLEGMRLPGPPELIVATGNEGPSAQSHFVWKMTKSSYLYCRSRWLISFSKRPAYPIIGEESPVPHITKWTPMLEDVGKSAI